MFDNSKTLDINTLMGPDGLATAIANEYVRLNMLRSSWLAEKAELRNYLFATDTKKTSNSKLPWKNSTTIPKLCQIRDNLHANYMAALFPNSDWLSWEGDTKDDNSTEKARVIRAFVKNKAKASGLERIVSKCVLDWIDTGNIIGTVVFVDESFTDKNTGEIYPGYRGPKLVRISPYDIVFDPTASSFSQSPKIIRTIKSLGSLKKDSVGFVDADLAKVALDKAIELRGKYNGNDLVNDNLKSDGFQIDGFGSIKDYFNSGMVEVLEFYGDMFDVETGEILENHVITVIDRAYVIRKEPNPNWLGRDHFFHIGWRERPDNLYAMGPLDNLVGMQYRIDHLENLKADAFDMIAFPMPKIRGDVEDFEYGPGEKIYVGDDGDVEFMHPDVTALNADNQIAVLELKMEELAGAPKQAMGIRTPGEKTMYEVASLENAASRIFNNKTNMLESEWLSHVMNAYLEIGRRNLASTEVVRSLDEDVDATIFETVTKEDLKASGKLRPVGASHFAKKARLVQNLTNMMNSPVGADPAVNVHLSGLKIAKLMEQALELEKFELVEENVRVFEQIKTQQLAQAASDEAAFQDQMGPEELAAAEAGTPQEEEVGFGG